MPVIPANIHINHITAGHIFKYLVLYSLHAYKKA